MAALGVASRPAAKRTCTRSLATGLQYIHDGVDDLTHVDGTRTTTPFRCWNQEFQERPLFICQIRFVCFSLHPSSLRVSTPLFKWPLRGVRFAQLELPRRSFHVARVTRFQSSRGQRRDKGSTHHPKTVLVVPEVRIEEVAIRRSGEVQIEIEGTAPQYLAFVITTYFYNL